MNARYNARQIDADVTCRNCTKTIPHGCISAIMLDDRTMYCCGCGTEAGTCPSCAPAATGCESDCLCWTCRVCTVIGVSPDQEEHC